MLTNKQKAYLAQLANRAFQAALSRRDGSVSASSDGISAEDWRRQEVAKACGKFGLRCCGQTDYKLVEGHFLNLIGETGRAMNAFVRAASEPKRQAEVVLLKELARYGFHQSYAEKICQSKFRCSISEASAGQTWKIMYDIRRNGSRKAKKLKETPA